MLLLTTGRHSIVATRSPRVLVPYRRVNHKPPKETRRREVVQLSCEGETCRKERNSAAPARGVGLGLVRGKFDCWIKNFGL